MSTQSLDSDIYDYGFILNSTALHEAAMSVLVTTIYGRWRTITSNRKFASFWFCSWSQSLRKSTLALASSIVRLRTIQVDRNRERLGLGPIARPESAPGQVSSVP